MKVAVTGANGFVGQYVVKRLLSEGHSVVTLDRSKSHFAGSAYCQSIDCDYTQKTYSHDEIGSPEVLIHLAWGGLPNYKSLHHFEVELPMQYRFLSNLVRTGLKHLVVSGTCFEYGSLEGELKESGPVAPNSPYSHAKNFLFTELSYLKGTHPYTLSWGRLFYPYGDGQGRNSLYSLLVKAIAEKQTSFNLSPGDQERDFIHVSDVAKMLVSLAISKVDAGIVNIGTGKPQQVYQFVESILSQANAKMVLNRGFYPYAEHEPMRFWASMDKFNSIVKNKGPA